MRWGPAINRRGPQARIPQVQRKSMSDAPIIQAAVIITTLVKPALGAATDGATAINGARHLPGPAITVAAITLATFIGSALGLTTFDANATIKNGI